MSPISRGRADTFMPGLKLAGDAAGKQGATGFQRRHDGPLTEHRSGGVAELRAVKAASRAVDRVSIRTMQRPYPNPLGHFSPAILSATSISVLNGHVFVKQ